MTITKRGVNSRPSAVDGSKRKGQVLDSISVDRMLNVLAQLGQLSDFAADMFSELFKVASDTTERISGLGKRVVKLESAVTAVEDEFATKPPAYFYKQEKASVWKSAPSTQQSLFTDATMPPTLAAARARAKAPPDFSAVEQYAGDDGPRPREKYSKPEFFYQTWLAEEEARQIAMKEERKRRRKARKKKKSKDKKQAKYQSEAKAIQVKVYDEFGGTTMQAAPTRASVGSSGAVVSRTVTLNGKTQQISESADPSPQHRAPAGGPPPGPPPPRGGGGPPAGPPPPRQVAAAAAPPPPRGGAAPPAPPPARAGVAAPAPPPPGAPAARGGPPAPPPPGARAAAPPMAAAPPPGGPPRIGGPPPAAPPPRGGPPMAASAPSRTPAPPSGRSNLLAAIRGGSGGLRKAAPRQRERKKSVRGGLMDAIRGRNVVLRKVDRSQVQKKKEPAGGPGLTGIMAVLARRAAIMGSDDEDSDSDEWSD